MFSNTPVATHRIRRPQNQGHAPPSYLPSHPLRRVPNAHPSYADENAVPLHLTADQREASSRISQSIDSPPRSISQYVQSQSTALNINGGSRSEDVDESHDSTALGGNRFRQYRGTPLNNRRQPIQQQSPNSTNGYGKICTYEHCNNNLLTRLEQGLGLFEPKTVTTTIPLRDSSPSRSSIGQDAGNAMNTDLLDLTDIAALEDEYQHILESEVPQKETELLNSVEENHERLSPITVVPPSRQQASTSQNSRSLHSTRTSVSPPTIASHQINTSQRSILKQTTPEISHNKRYPKRDFASPEVQQASTKHVRIESARDQEFDENETESEYESPSENEIETTGDANESYKSANLTFNNSSFIISEREAEGENVALELFQMLFEKIQELLKFSFIVTTSMAKQLFHTLFANGLLVRVATLGLLLSVFVYLVTTLSYSSSKPFEHPSFPPETLEEFASRLVTVENEISSLHKSSTGSITDMQRHLTHIAERLDILNNAQSTTAKQVMDSAKEISIFETSLLDLENVLKTVRTDLDNEVSHGMKIDTELASNFETVSTLADSMERTTGELNKLKKRVSYLESTENAEKYILDVLDKQLPSRVVVMFDPISGSISAAPEFWKFLATQLALRNIIPTVDGEPREQVSFEEFMMHNQKAIDDYMDDYLSKNANRENENSAVVGKEMFKNMIEEELGSFKIDTVEELERLHNEVTGVKTQLKRQQLSNGPSQGNTAFNGTETALELLIKSAIQKQVTHTISKPDFADPAFGARIMPALTSKSYNWRDGLEFANRQLHNFLGVLGFGRMQVNGPSTAFNNDMALRACWPFNGNVGQVAVNLGTYVHPSDIGIVHVGPEESPNPSSAPRRISLWVQVEDPALRSKISHLIDQSGVQEDAIPPLFLPPQLPPDYVKIMSVEYDINSGDEFQVFSVPLHIKRLGLVTSKAIFRIESNWGNKEYTCVYRLRLFGERAQIEPEVEGEEGAEDTFVNADDGFFINEQPTYSNAQDYSGDDILGNDEPLD